MNRIPTVKSKIKVGFKGIAYDTDESVMDPAYSPRALNFTFGGGALRGELGVDPAAGRYIGSMDSFHVYPDFPENVEICDVFPYFRREGGAYDDRIVVRTSENKLYQTKIFSRDTWHEIEGLTREGRLSAVNYNYGGNDVLLISSDAEALAIYDGVTVKTVDAAPRFTSLAVHFERIYGAVNGRENQVWFSDDFNPENWNVSSTEAGFISFADECGDIIKVISFLNYLYIFREHGIFRLTAYGDQSEYSLKKVFTDTGRIFKDTISPCGDRIIFLAEEGLFSFDGYNVARIAREMTGIIFPNNAVGACSESKYYLACLIDLPEFDTIGSFNNVVYCYDLREKTLSVIAPVDVKKLAPCNVHESTELLVLFNRKYANRIGMIGTRGRIMGSPSVKYYYSPVNVLGTGRVKIVRDVTLTATKPITLSVKTDGDERDYEIEGSPLAQTIFIGKSGRSIGFKIKSESVYPYVSPLIVSMEAMNG